MMVGIGRDHRRDRSRSIGIMSGIGRDRSGSVGISRDHPRDQSGSIGIMVGISQDRSGSVGITPGISRDQPRDRSGSPPGSIGISQDHPRDRSGSPSGSVGIGRNYNRDRSEYVFLWENNARSTTSKCNTTACGTGGGKQLKKKRTYIHYVRASREVLWPI